MIMMDINNNKYHNNNWLILIINKYILIKNYKQHSKNKINLMNVI